MRKLHALLLILLSVGLVRAQAQPSLQPRALVLRGVTIIDMTGALPKPDMTIVIFGSRIAAVGKSKDVSIPKDARVVDAIGKFLIPGFWDMHWHSRSKSETLNVLFPLTIANGVTGVRDMFSDCIRNCETGRTNIKAIKKWRRQFSAGTLVAPRILASSQIVDGAKPTWQSFYPVANADQARKAVRIFKGRGDDFIKIYSLLSRDAFFATADEAKKQKIPLAGHIPIYITAIEASNAGQKSIEHLDFSGAFSTREAELMRDATIAIERIKNDPYFGPLLYNVLDTNLVRAADSYDSRRLVAVSNVFVKNGTWVCPTLAYHHADAFHDQKEYAEDPRLKYMPKDLQDEWVELKNARVSMPHRMAEMKRVFPASLKIIGEMRRAGVNFLAGTDATNIHVLPGFSLHDELAFLVKAGFTPMEALQAATINPARFMDREKDLGTIEKGKFSDLVVLEANPIDDISNTKKIAAVVINGRYLSKGALQKMLAAASTSAKKR